MKHSFTDYIDNSKKLFKIVFGNTKFNSLTNTKLKPFKWDGLDITTSMITVNSPNIKQMFNKNNINYIKLFGKETKIR